MTDGVVDREAERLQKRLAEIFGKRLSGASMEGDDLYFIVATTNGRISGSEFVRIAVALEVPVERIEFEDLHPDSVRFIVDVAPVTSPCTPSALERRRP